MTWFLHTLSVRPLALMETATKHGSLMGTPSTVSPSGARTVSANLYLRRRHANR